MDLLKPIKTLIKRGQSKVEEYFDEQAMINKAIDLNDEFNIARSEKSAWDTKFNNDEQRYLGDREMNNIRTSNTKDDARTVIKLGFMLIEAQIDLSIPEPVFKPVSADDDVIIKELQAEADYTLRSNDLDKINSTAERDVKKLGSTIYKVLWDNNYKGAGFRGRIKIIGIHPKNIIPFAGTIDFDTAEGCFHAENVTLATCKRRYGKIAEKLPGLGQLYTEYDEVGKNYDSNVNKTNDIHNTPENYRRPSDHPLTKYTIIEKWYLDEEGDVGLTTFSGKLVLLDKPKFYYRRDYDAENKQFRKDENGNEILLREEEVLEDYTVEETVDGKKVKTTKLKKGEKVPYYIPKTIPIIIQNNVPRSKCVWGISDNEIIGDIDEAIKKVIYKHEERMLKGTKKVLYNKNSEDEAANMLNNVDLQIVGVNDVNSFKEVDFTADDNATLAFYNLLLSIGQQQLGVTQVWQGFNSGEAKSGKAIDSLIKQTAEKVSIKVNEKNIAYKKIYRLVCDFLLAFADGNRPYRLDNSIQPTYGVFNRYNMLKKDNNGNWVYPDWDIDISAESGFPRTKTFMFDSVIQLASQGFLEPTPTNVMVWTMLSKIGFPNAESILQKIQEQVNQMQSAPAGQSNIPGNGQPNVQTNGQPDIETVISQLPSDVQEQFRKLTPEEQAQALQGGQNVQG